MPGKTTLAGFCAALVLAVLSMSFAAGARALDMQRIQLAARGEIPWQSLTEEEQKALREYRRDWESLDTDRQLRIREGAQRYLSMPPEKRQELEQQRERYEQLSPEEKRDLRKRYQRENR